MPNYTFKDNNTNEEFTLEMKIAERDEFLEKNSNIEQLIVSAPFISYGTFSVNNVPKGFNNLMKKIKKANRGSNISTGNITEI